MSKTRRIQPIILAAGASTRMKRSQSKLLHQLLGKTLVERSIEIAGQISKGKPMLVLGHQREEIRQSLDSVPFDFCIQDPPRGTGDALRVALEGLSDGQPDDHLFIMGADAVLVTPKSLQEFLKVHETSQALMTFMTTDLDQPGQYGRVVRSISGGVEAIVEAKEADPATLQLREINAGFYLIERQSLQNFLKQMEQSKNTLEYYLTDIVAWLRKQQKLVMGFCVDDPTEAKGINSCLELSEAETILCERLIGGWSAQGVRFHQPSSQYLEESVELAPDVEIFPGCILKGKTRVESGSQIGPYAVVEDSEIGRGSKVQAFCHLKGASLSKDVSVGPYARIRPGSCLEEGSKLGNFVEVKNTHLQKGAKANHLSYLGDAEIGQDSNVGAGTITCNYDGFKKAKTKLGRNVFIGSNSSLVAPVDLGDDVIVGAGSVITESVEAGALAVSRGEQVNRPGAAQRFRDKKRD